MNTRTGNTRSANTRAVNARAAHRYARILTAELCADIRAAPIPAAGVALAAAATARTVAAALTGATTSPDPWAAVDAAILATVSTVVGWLFAIACLAWTLGAVAFLWWLIPRRLYRVTVRLGNKPRRTGRTPIGIASAVALSAIAIGTVAFSGWVTIATFTVLATFLTVTTTQYRRQQRLIRALRHSLGLAAPGDTRHPSRGWRVRHIIWTQTAHNRPTLGHRLQQATIFYPDTVRVAEPARRQAIERAIGWVLRADPDTQYTIAWLKTIPAVHLAAEPRLPQTLPDQAWPVDLPGIVVGVCAPAHADATVTTTLPDGTTETLPVRLWNPSTERDLLIVGVKGSGKTVLQRGLIVRWAKVHPGQQIWILDGKFGADYAALEGREGIAVVARTPEQWRAALETLTAQMRQRYDQNFEYEAGRAPQPSYDEQLIVIDEIHNVRHILGDEADGFIGTLGRMARAARMRLIVATQRPDVKDAIPGAIRDQLEDRIAVGWMSRVGAQMVFEQDWQAITGTHEQPIIRPRGYAVARIAGHISPIQIPNLPTPVADPTVETLYPPKNPQPTPERTGAANAPPQTDTPPEHPPATGHTNEPEPRKHSLE